MPPSECCPMRASRACTPSNANARGQFNSGDHCGYTAATDTHGTPRHSTNRSWHPIHRAGIQRAANYQVVWRAQQKAPLVRGAAAQPNSWRYFFCTASQRIAGGPVDPPNGPRGRFPRAGGHPASDREDKCHQHRTAAGAQIMFAETTLGSQAKITK
jgi:hypothetical protein